MDARVVIQKALKVWLFVGLAFVWNLFGIVDWTVVWMQNKWCDVTDWPIPYDQPFPYWAFVIDSVFAIPRAALDSFLNLLVEALERLSSDWP